jgi:hypothetical protein
MGGIYVRQNAVFNLALAFSNELLRLYQQQSRAEQACIWAEHLMIWDMIETHRRNVHRRRLDKDFVSQLNAARPLAWVPPPMRLQMKQQIAQLQPALSAAAAEEQAVVTAAA